MLADIDNQKNLTTIEARAKIVDKHLLRSIELYQKDFTSWNNLGTLYFTVYHDYDKAISYYQKALKSNPFNAEEPYYNIGVCYGKLKEFDLALKAHQEAILIKPSFLQSYLATVDIYLEMEDRENAISSVDRMIVQFPDNDQGYLKKGSIYLDFSDTSNAVSCFENALKINPSNYELSLSLKDYFYSVGDYEKSSFYESLGNRYVSRQKKHTVKKSKTVY
jgi:tetratricopeptide (TPR) repeat protein